MATISKTDATLRERAQGAAERVLLGSNSIDGTVRVLGFILLFVVVFGTLFHFAG